MKSHYFHITTALVFTLFACKKASQDKIDNPYDKVVIVKDISGNKDSAFSPSSIEGLHKNLFQPTCANSGCHDGTFEPDFRTVQSTYNTLVNIKPIKNDPTNPLAARVVPGNADASNILYRMTVNLGGNSGIMPLVLDPGSDFPAKKDEHLANIKKWINDGAKDFNGNPPPSVNFPPQIMGVVAYAGASLLPRGGKYEPLYASAGTSVQFWFALSDDVTAQSALTDMKINWSSDPSNYSLANEQNLVTGNKTTAGLYDANTVYGWNYTFSTAGYKTNDVIWFKISCNDGTNANYNIPNVNSMFFLKKYFALKIL